MTPAMSDVLGAIIAGGQSARYGSPKALAMVGGERVVDRVIRAVRAVSGDVVVIANDEGLAKAIGLEWRPDRLPGLGPLGGFDAALAWAAERGFSGIFAVACDMPFLSSDLLMALAQLAMDTGADAVLPESNGPRGVEPLTAYYSVSCIPAISAAAARGDNRLIGFHSDIHMERLPLVQVRTFGDPDTMFMNMNTPEDRVRVESLL